MLTFDEAFSEIKQNEDRKLIEKALHLMFCSLGFTKESIVSIDHKNKTMSIIVYFAKDDDYSRIPDKFGDYTVVSKKTSRGRD